jgi:hypothetical protein
MLEEEENQSFARFSIVEVVLYSLFYSCRVLQECLGTYIGYIEGINYGEEGEAGLDECLGFPRP